MIKWGIEVLQYYFLGREFKLITDHEPLKWLQMTKSDNAHLMWWSLVLQPYKFQVEHRPGLEHIVANFFSCIHEEEAAKPQRVRIVRRQKERG